MPITQPVFDDVAPWPEKPKPAEALSGHNKPPVEEEARAAFREALLTDRPDFEQKVEDIMAAADRAKVVDDESYARGGSFIKLVRAAIDHVDTAHKSAKAHYLTGGRVVDAEKNELGAKLMTARNKVQGQLNDYAAKKEAEARAERERVAAERRGSFPGSRHDGPGTHYPGGHGSRHQGRRQRRHRACPDHHGSQAGDDRGGYRRIGRHEAVG
ncbi:hypothetical protein [Novosphingobium sp. EMRT-2]|uniref:hypothetical protein n=1 Tax=Novosphingobium sp. EMRT-2 TaxID=2571749 RepID=UPI0010BDF6FB|nr:hypothetical protein [Novosphingobium sp. EMRT-2]QCI93355.1 hypothetical protein FA702_07175 [Novosphingobium sp. EMRT-2]